MNALQRMTIKDISTECAVSMETAKKDYQDIKKHFKLHANARVCLYHVYTYFNIPIDELKK